MIYCIPFPKFSNWTRSNRLNFFVLSFCAVFFYSFVNLVQRLKSHFFTIRVLLHNIFSLRKLDLHFFRFGIPLLRGTDGVFNFLISSFRLLARKEKTLSEKSKEVSDGWSRGRFYQRRFLLCRLCESLKTYW